MWKWFAALLSCFLASGALPAQEEMIKDLTPDHVEKFIKDVMKTTIEQKDENAKEKIVVFLTPDSYFDVIYDGGKKEIVFRYGYAMLEAKEEKLNQWNRLDGNLARVTSNEGVLIFVGKTSFAKGISLKQLKVLHDQFKKEEIEFRAFVEKGQLPNRDVSNVVRHAFPSRDAKDPKTKWEIEWDMVPSPNGAVRLLRIKGATFSFKDNKGEWKSVPVVRNVQLVEAFAPYDDGVTAFLDLASKGRADKAVSAKEELKGPNCVAPAEILTSKDGKYKIYRDVHDDGIRWMKGFGNNAAVRGEKLVLTAIFQAVNYVYLMEYVFTDDGRIVCRLGFTGHNFYNRGRSRNRNAKDGDVHLHVGCWRMDFDLGDPRANNYQIVRRYFDTDENLFRVGAAAFNDGREGKAKWVAEEFTTLRVVSGKEKSIGSTRPIAYDLIPTRMGSVRNLVGKGDVRNADMDFVNYDFWVTHAPSQGAAAAYHRVPTFAAEQRPLKGQPVTVWYNAPGIHVPRGEDFGGAEGQTAGSGVALTTWIEFTLRPRDMFDSTPLYP